MALLLQKGDYRLRAPEPEDLDCLLTFENEASNWGINTEATGPYSRYQMKLYLAHATNNIYEDKQLRLLIENKKSKVVGIIDLSNFDAMNNRAEVGILIAPKYQRKGIATFALEMIEEHAFKRIGIHQLYAYIQVNNNPSRKLFQNLGFKESAHLIDWIRIADKYTSVVMVQKLSPLV
ncbi:MAG: GNAT family N-acetyltransferase [Phocaeicola sp.]